MQPSWKNIKFMVDVLASKKGIPYKNLNSDQKKMTKRKLRWDTVEKMISLLTGSHKIADQESFLHDRLQSLHPEYHPYTWKKLDSFLLHLTPLEKFKNTPEQNLKHRYKYPLVTKLVDLLIGNCKENPRTEISYRTQFLRVKFPQSFKPTWP